MSAFNREGHFVTTHQALARRNPCAALEKSSRGCRQIHPGRPNPVCSRACLGSAVFLIAHFRSCVPAVEHHGASSKATAISNVIPAISTWPKRAMVNSICSLVSICLIPRQRARCAEWQRCVNESLPVGLRRLLRSAERGDGLCFF